MAEGDLEKNADFTQIYNRHHGEEDPIVAAQRYLNIFRQLHIFSQHKRKEFEDTLVNLPLSVKRAFSQLPGGSVLHEFVNELELKAGMEVSDKGSAPAPEAETQPSRFNNDISQAKILANALAEAQSKISTASPAVSQVEIKRLSDELNQKFDAMKKDLEKSVSTQEIDLKNLDASVLESIQKAIENKVNKGGSVSFPESLVVSPSPEFKDSIEQIVDKFLATTQQNQKQNTEDLAKIISESQIKLAQIINDKGSSSSGKEIADALANVIEKNAEANRKANAELIGALKSVNVARVNEDGVPTIVQPSVDVESIIDNIVEKQTNMFKEFSQRQSDALGNVMSNVLKETNSSSMEMFYHALETFQKESSKILQMQVSIQKALLLNSKNLQNFAKQNNDDSNVVSNAMPQFSSQPSQESDFGKMADELLNLDVELPKKKKKKKKKKKNNDEVPSSVASYNASGFETEYQDETAGYPDDYSRMTAYSSGKDAIRYHDETSDSQTSPHIYTDSDGQMWEYVEDDGSDGDGQEWEYIEDDGSVGDGQEWEYVEDDGSAGDGQEWEYVEDDGSAGDEQEWEYVEDDAASDDHILNDVPTAVDKEPIEFSSAPLESNAEQNIETEPVWNNISEPSFSLEEKDEGSSVLKDDYFDLEPEKASQETAPETSKSNFNPDLAEKVEFPQMEKEPDAPFVPTIKLSGSDDTSTSDPFFSA